MELQAIIEDCGIAVSGYEPVHGGDINRCYCLYAGNHKYFLKINDALQYPGMFEKEAAGLDALKNNFSLVVPAVIKHGNIHQQQYLLLQWIERAKASTNSMQSFGAALATMHKKQQPYFGWALNNYIGSLPQDNTRHDEWPSFYRACRIMPLVQLLFSRGAFSQQDIKAAENFCKTTGRLFPDEPPSLLHGDLWSGNFMVSSDGAAIYDPAVYHGHREMDIGMTQLFGGFDQRFYDGYNEVYPLEKNWQQRLPLTQLYPLLVHAVLFGGHYISSVRAIIAMH